MSQPRPLPHPAGTRPNPYGFPYPTSSIQAQAPAQAGTQSRSQHSLHPEPRSSAHPYPSTHTHPPTHPQYNSQSTSGARMPPSSYPNAPLQAPSNTVGEWQSQPIRHFKYPGPETDDEGSLVAESDTSSVSDRYWKSAPPPSPAQPARSIPESRNTNDEMDLGNSKTPEPGPPPYRGAPSQPVSTTAGPGVGTSGQWMVGSSERERTQHVQERFEQMQLHQENMRQQQPQPQGRPNISLNTNSTKYGNVQLPAPSGQGQNLRDWRYPAQPPANHVPVQAPGSTLPGLTTPTRFSSPSPAARSTRPRKAEFRAYPQGRFDLHILTCIFSILQDLDLASPCSIQDLL
jgi:hypothetical protein